MALWLVVARTAPACVVPAVEPMLIATDDVEPGQGVSFVGRVVELETKQPLADASILLVRFLRGADSSSVPPWAGESTIRTDGDGRFRLTFPPEQVATHRLSITLRVSHPGFVARKSLETELAELIRGQAMGDRPFFETITMEKGREYTGQVITPAGKPAAEMLYFIENWTRTENHSPGFNADCEGRTDSEGRFRLRMPESHSIALYLTAPQPARARFPYAPFQHFYGTAEPGQHPDVRAPTDFGRIVLERGVRLLGRLVDREGRPIAGQTITAYPVLGRDQHSTTTEADGGFVLGPLRRANYTIYGEGQDGTGGVDPIAAAPRSSARVFKPVKVYMREDVAPEPLLLREIPTVRVEVQFVDSRGSPARGGAAKLWGIIPNEHGVADGFAAHRTFGSGLASEINDPEPQDQSDRIDWSMQNRPGSDGRIVFRVPGGLQQATLNAYPDDATIAYKTRLEERGPLKYWGGGALGTLEKDRKITIVSYRAPTVIVTVNTDDGHPPDETVVVTAKFVFNMGSYGERFTRQADGRYRAPGLMPDHEYTIVASSRAYVPTVVPRVTLAEGGSTALTVTVRRRPKPPEIGKPAPPFLVRTRDGTPLKLDGLRGRFVLLHFWQPNLATQGLDDLIHLKAVADQFGKDDRFTMISLCLVDDPKVADRNIAVSGMSWRQVVLRDHGLDPMAIDYQPFPTPKSFLIGPDGMLIAKDLNGIQVEKSVSKALAR